MKPEMIIKYPDEVKIYELGARDGLQSEKKILSVDEKVRYINGLSKCGYKAIEVGSLVNTKLIPQMSKTDNVFMKLDKKPECQYFVLVGSSKYLLTALEAGVKNISFMASASNLFSLKNTHFTLAESVKILGEMLKICQKNNIYTRVYISCCFDCPYQGKIEHGVVNEVIDKLIQLGCDELSLADTTGKATILQVEHLLNASMKKLPLEKLAVHFHNSYSQAMVNTLVSLQMGVINVDSSVGELGGCPYAKNPLVPREHQGNLGTEALLYMLDGLNINTGVSIEKVLTMKQYIFKVLNRTN